MKQRDKLRLFIAITLPEPVRDNLSRLIRELAGRLPGVRWAPAGNIHLTLKFLGRVEADKIPQIRGCLDRIAGRHLPLTIGLGGMGSFPSGRRPRVIWAGVGEGWENLSGLAIDLDRALAELGFPPEARDYTPHLTLGRVKDGPDFAAAVLEREIERRKRDSLGSFNSDMIVLLQSTLTPQGAIHRVVSRHRPEDRIKS